MNLKRHKSLHVTLTFLPQISSRVRDGLSLHQVRAKAKIFEIFIENAELLLHHERNEAQGHH